MYEFVVLTKNKDKFKEIRAIARENLKIDSPFLYIKDFSFNIEVIEDGNTYKENAIKKVLAYKDFLKDKFLLADDSGLEIEFFDNKPGIYSARFLHPLNYKQKNNYILNKMKEISYSKRKAKFVCVAALYDPYLDTIKTFKGVLQGVIGYQQKGSFGFGYDPIFYLPDKNKYLAELKDEEKNLISHRAKAFLKLFVYFNNLYNL